MRMRRWRWGKEDMDRTEDLPEPVVLSPEEEAELSEAMEQIDRGEYIDGEALLEDLRARNLG
jgi:hypothetical protein